MMGLLSKLFKDSSDEWMKDASKDELSEKYELERQKWIKDGYNHGTGEKTSNMKKLDKEISRRAAEEWEKNPNRNTDPYFRWTDANRWED